MRGCERPALWTGILAGSPIINQYCRGMASHGNQMNVAAGASAQERELAQLIVTALNLDVGAGDIDPAAPLYRDGLGLDSIDILEIALAISQQYGLQLRADDSDNARIFSSLRDLNEYVQQHRSR